MDELEVRVYEQVRLYRHLYDPSMQEYRDFQMAQNSWTEIAWFTNVTILLDEDLKVKTHSWTKKTP